MLFCGNDWICNLHGLKTKPRASVIHLVLLVYLVRYFTSFVSSIGLIFSKCSDLHRIILQESLDGTESSTYHEVELFED